MTDAMSRREIEDVLSSIRRLVSHDVSPTTSFVSATQSGPQAGRNTAEKLLLTSALRVDGPRAAPQVDASLAFRSDARSEALSGSVHMPFGPGAQISSTPDHSEADPAPCGRPAPEFLPGQTEPALPDIAGVSADAPLDEGRPHFTPHGPSLLARISGAGRRPETEQDLLRPLAALGRIGPGPQDEAPLPEDAAIPPEESAAPDPQATVLDPSSSAVSMAQRVEDSALEATLARLEDLLAGAVRDDTKAVVARDDPDPSEDLIDEGVLYQLVAHIVRQELQGELGEKITRNIRKLVRSEVARELQLRQF